MVRSLCFSLSHAHIMFMTEQRDHISNKARNFLLRGVKGFAWVNRALKIFRRSEIHSNSSVGIVPRRKVFSEATQRRM
jgi:hypothetical protein